MTEFAPAGIDENGRLPLEAREALAADAASPDTELGAALSATIASRVGEGGYNIEAPFTSLADEVTGEGFIAKPTGDGRPGIIGWQHADDSGYLFHFESRAGGAAPAMMIGIGLDNDDGAGGLGVGGILIANKAAAQGIILHQHSTITNANAYALYVRQQSTVAGAVRLNTAVDGAASLLTLAVEAGVTITDPDTKSQRWVISANDLAGDISAYDGTLRWLKAANLRNTQVNTVLTLKNDTGAGNPATLLARGGGADPAEMELSADYTNSSDASLRFYRPTGSATYYPSRIIAKSNEMMFQVGVSAAKGAETFSDSDSPLRIRYQRVGFFGTAPQNKPTGVAVTPEGIHAALVTLGLIGA